MVHQCSLIVYQSSTKTVQLVFSAAYHRKQSEQEVLQKKMHCWLLETKILGMLYGSLQFHPMKERPTPGWLHDQNCSKSVHYPLNSGLFHIWSSSTPHAPVGTTKVAFQKQRGIISDPSVCSREADKPNYRL